MIRKTLSIKHIFAMLLLTQPILVVSGELYVDNSNNCAGLSTCYLSIQDALNNAQTNDEIRVFPGTYIESVDLSLMGSALGPATGGNIIIITVDSNNNNLAGTVNLAPLNGPAFTHSGSFFQGNIELNGFSVVSLDDDGIDLDLVGGNITIRNMTASDNNNDGIDLEVATGGHTMRVINTIANNNGSDGLNLDGPDGTITYIQNVQANNNRGEGISVISANDGDIHQASILDTILLDNGDDLNASAGIHTWFEGDLTIRNLKASDNHGPGLVVSDVTQTNINDSTFDNNAAVEGYSGVIFQGSGELLVRRSVFSGNGNSGVIVHGSNLKGHELTTVNVGCSSFTGNLLGVDFTQSASNMAQYSISQSNFSNQSVAGVHASVNNDAISTINNWWGDASGPTHTNNPTGTGDNVSDSIDDQVGGALGTIVYTPFLTAPSVIKQYPSDTFFAGDFEGNACTQF